MSKVQQIDVPQGSLLADYGPPEAYRDCYAREVPGAVSLPEFIERFYCSMAFRPERLALGLIGRGTSNEHAARLARGEVESFAAWHVVERRAADGGPQGRQSSSSGVADGPQGQPIGLQERPPAGQEVRGDRSTDVLRTYKNPEILLRDFQGATASWLSVEQIGDGKVPSSSSEAVGQKTRLLFGSWVGKPDRPIVRALMPFHRWYSRVLLGGVQN